MFGFKFTSKFSALLLVLSFSSITAAAPYTVTYTDTIQSSEGPYIGGEPFVISIVLDNGGSTTASQTWTSADIVSITFSLNDSPGTITTVLSPVLLSNNTGSFVTDAGGILTAVPSNWSDTAPLSTVLSTNDPGLLVLDFFINSGNDVYLNESTSNHAGMTNVSNNTTAAFWTNPGSAPVPATPVPTMSIWAIGILSGMIGLLGMYHRRRK